jgi:hypothetical protein
LLVDCQQGNRSLELAPEPTEIHVAKAILVRRSYLTRFEVFSFLFHSFNQGVNRMMNTLIRGRKLAAFAPVVLAASLAASVGIPSAFAQSGAPFSKEFAAQPAGEYLILACRSTPRALTRWTAR